MTGYWLVDINLWLLLGVLTEVQLIAGWYAVVALWELYRERN